MTKGDLAYHNPYANLAAAIIASGERCHDVSFLESDWCDTLYEICKLDDQMYGHRKVATRGKQHISSAHVPLEVN